MKIQDYNQMMAYLTRPATPTETPDIRQPAASGGVIGQGGMFQGEDLGDRTGFADPIKKPITDDFFKKYLESNKGKSFLEMAEDLTSKGYIPATKAAKVLTDVGLTGRAARLGIKGAASFIKDQSLQDVLREATDATRLAYKRGEIDEALLRKRVIGKRADIKRYNDPKTYLEILKQREDYRNKVKTDPSMEKQRNSLKASRSKFKAKEYLKYGIPPEAKTAKQFLFRDLFRIAQESEKGDRLKLAKNFAKSDLKAGKFYSNLEIIDTVTGKKFNFNNVEKYISSKNTGFNYRDVIKPYEQKVFINKTPGLRTEINSKMIPNWDTGNKNTFFEIQHVEGKFKNPFNVHLASKFSNAREGVVRARFDKAWEKTKTLSDKKELFTEYTDNLPKGIASQPGMITRTREFGERVPFDELLRETKQSGVKLPRGILKIASEMEKNGASKNEATKVSKAIQSMTNKFGSGLDPMDVARWAGAELEVIKDVGLKYGGKVFNNLAAIDVPLAQVLFAKEVTDFSEDSPLWTTLPMAFTDEVSKYYNLYDRSGGKISNFIKLAASSGVPAKLAKTIFPIVSKAGKIGSTYALPALQLGQELYNEKERRDEIDYEGEKFERLFPDKISKNKMMEDYRQDQRDRVPELTDDMDVPEISERGQQNLDSIKRGAQSLGSLFGLADDPYAYSKPNIPGTPLVTSDYSDGGAVDIKDVIQEYNNGGRVGYADGPKDPKRRTVIKGLTALAALPIVGRYFKLAKPVDKAISGVQTVIEKVKGLPDWFQPFVNKVLKVGKDVTDEAATIDREIVKRVDIEDATVDVHYNTATNDVRVEVVGGKNAFDEPLEMQYKAPEVIEETGKKTKGEFSAAESRPVQTSPDDIELDGYDTDVLDDLLSETDYLEGFATGKIRTPAEIKKAKLRAKMREDAQRDPGSLLDDFDD